MKSVFNILCLTSCFYLMSCAAPDKESEKNDSHEHQHHAASPAGYADSVNAGIILNDTLKSSPLRLTMVNLEKQHIHLAYSSPGVKNRIVWGGLVPYDQVWVTGAHKANQISFTRPVNIQGTTIPEGIYGLFTIPQKDKWTVILNKNSDQHLTDEYTETDDVWRGDVSVTELENSVPRLTFTFIKKDEQTATLQFAWHKKGFDLDISNATK